MKYYYDATDWLESYQVELDAIDAELASVGIVNDFIVVTNRYDDLS